MNYIRENAQQTAVGFSMEINTENINIITFRRMELIRNKICIDHKIMKQINNFINL